MKKLIFVLMAVALLVPMAAFACHNAIEVDTSDCGEATITGTFYGDSRYAKVAVYVDGILKGEAIEYRLLGNASASKTVTVTSGSTVTVKGYTKANILSGWVLRSTNNQAFAIEDCYQSCQEGNVEEYDCTDPVFNVEFMRYEWTCQTKDVNTGESCGEVGHNDVYVECSKQVEVVLDGRIEQRDINTGALCGSECRDRWKQQSYGLFELEGPNGEYATMYVYADENGKLPIGISVDRQECVLGWVAVNTPYAGWVYKNPCTGEYKWNDQVFTPRQDVIKDGVCNRSGECLK